MRVYGIARVGTGFTVFYMTEAQVGAELRRWTPEQWGFVTLHEMTEQKFESLPQHRTPKNRCGAGLHAPRDAQGVNPCATDAEASA